MASTIPRWPGISGGSRLRLVDQLNPDLFHSGWMFHPVDINLAFYTLTPLNGLLSIPLQLALGADRRQQSVAAFVVCARRASAHICWCASCCRLWGCGGTVPAYLAAVLAGWHLRLCLSQALLCCARASSTLPAASGSRSVRSTWCAWFRRLHMRGKLRAGAMAGLFLVFQAWAELTYASFLLLFIGLLFVMVAALWQGLARALAGRRTASFYVAAIFVLRPPRPFLAAMAPDLAAEGDFFGRGGGFADVFSADLQGYLVPTGCTLGSANGWQGWPFPTTKASRSMSAIPWLCWRLRAVGACGGGKMAIERAPVAGCCSGAWRQLLFFLLTLGPQVRWAGQPLPLARAICPGQPAAFL